MTAKQTQLVEKWRKLLRVQDWEIKFKEKKRFKGNPHTFAWTKPLPLFKTATIAIRKGLGDELFELTLVHELLHVVFPTASMKSLASEADAVELEQGVEGLARLLVRLDHDRRSRG